jgi:hypothetical protein
MGNGVLNIVKHEVEIAPEREADSVSHSFPHHLQALEIQRRVKFEMVARMGSADDMRDPVLDGHLSHGYRDFNIRGPVIEAEEQMVVNIYH